MCDYLTNEQGFKPENIKRFDSLDEYPRSLENNEIKAAILIAPQAEIFLATYCKGYITAGTPLTLGGLGFVGFSRPSLPLCCLITPNIELLKSFICRFSLEVQDWQ